MKFTSIHNHTDVSNLRLLDCIIKPNKLIDRALELDYSGVAITDHEAMSSLPEGLKHIMKLKEDNPDDKKIQDFKLILGNEVYVVNDLKATKADYKEYGNGFYHLVLLAKNERGYHLLKRLSSQAWVNSYRGRGMERVPLPKEEMKRIIGDEKGNLIASTACLGSEFSRAIIARFLAKQQVAKSERIIEEFVAKKKSAYDIEQEQLKLEMGRAEVQKYQRDLDGITAFYEDLLGKDDYYIEIQPSASAEQLAYNREAVDYAKENGLQWIVATDSHYLKKEDSTIHEAYLNSKDGDREVAEFYSTTYMQDIDEMKGYLEQSKLTEEEINTAIENTHTIYEKCETYTIFRQQEIPLIKGVDKRLEELMANEEVVNTIAKMKSDKYEAIKQYIDSENEQERYFIHSCVSGMLEKDIPYEEVYLSRIDEEITELIGISKKMNRSIAQYYVTAQKLVELMWEEGDSLVGPARGSVTGFFTAYLLDIVQIDAIKWGLPHWRHISASRPEYPDIDLDSQALKRGQIISAIKDFFGHFNVLNICTFGTEKSKNALLTACRGLGIDSDVGLYLSSLVPIERGIAWNLTDCFNGDEEHSRKPVTELINEVSKYPNLKETAMGIEGLINKRSVHASGVYIFNDGFINYTPMMRAPNGQPVTQYDMDNADLCGGMKFDVLTIEALDKIRKTMDLLIEDNLIQDQGSLKATYDKYLHPDVLDYETSEMWENVANNDIVSLFQYEKDGGLTAAQKLKPTSLVELANGNSLMRLMPMEGEMNPIDKYALFKENPSLWDQEMVKHGLTKEEREILHEHYDYCSGVPSAQEDVMRMVMDPRVLNKDLLVANKFRKVIAKKQTEAIEELKKEYAQYGKESGASKELLNYVWHFTIEPQLGYGFSI